MSAVGDLVTVVLVVEFLASAWVYVDATKNGSTPAFAWALLTLFTGLIGLFLYVVFGRETDPTADG